MSRRTLGLGLALVVLTAGCSTGAAKQTLGPGSSSAVQTAPEASATPPSSAPATTGGATSSPATSGPVSATATSSAPPARPADFCTPGQLSVRVLEGGAIQGYEIAAVHFTNSSTKTCSISGAPSVRLMRGGKVLVAGKSAPQQGSLLRLGPGEVAEAQIRDHSTCEAPLSDSIEVAGPPGLEQLTAKRPGFEMRGCEVTVYPVGPPS